MRLFKRHKFIVVVLMVVATVVGIVFAYNFQRILIVNKTILEPSNVTSSIRILHLSDLHNTEFGSNNTKLIANCKSQNPDIILITGDLINMDAPDTDVAADLITELTDIAPVYASLGNHEIANEESYGTDCKAVFEAAGAVVLDREYVDITVNDQPIRLGGIYGYCLPEKFLETNEADPEECAFLTDFQDTDRYTILMCHMPVCWLINDGLNEWDVDCVFSGHAHGGQIILPFIGGLYAPDMGFFPGDLKGVFHAKDNTKHMVLSSGLGSGTWVPRINNRPEIVNVEIKPQQEAQ